MSTNTAPTSTVPVPAFRPRGGSALRARRFVARHLVTSLSAYGVAAILAAAILAVTVG